MSGADAKWTDKVSQWMDYIRGTVQEATEERKQKIKNKTTDYISARWSCMDIIDVLVGGT